MKGKMYGLIISMTAAFIMADCGRTSAVQGKSGAESIDAQTSPPQNLKGTTQKLLSPGTDIEPADEITFWSTKKDCFAELREGFTRETGIKVNVTYMDSHDDMVNKAMAGIVGKRLPNVTQLGRRHRFIQMYDSGYLLPVEDYTSKDIMDGTLPSFWKRSTYKGKKVVLPFQNNMPMPYHNKTMFDQADISVPKAMEGVVSATKEIKDVTGNYGLASHNDYPWYTMVLVYSSSTAPIAGNKPQVNTESVKKIFE